MAFNNIDINSLTKSYDAYDNPILVDAQGNTYNPTYGGEMNTLQSLSKVSDMNGVPLSQYFDANGNFIYANENKNYGTGSNGIAHDYDINGNMTERAFVNDPWGDIKQAAILLGGSALGANALGALFGAEAGSLFGAGAAGAGTTGLTAEQLATMNALGGSEVAGGLTASQAATAGLGGGVTGAGAGLLGTTGLTAEQLAAVNGLGGADVAGGLTAADAATAGLGGGFAGTVAGAGLTTGQIANLLKAGTSLLGTAGAVNTLTGGGGNTGGGTGSQTPTQGVPANSGDYYSQLQQYYNGFMPNSPRDVVSPLKDWYSTTYGGTPVTNTGTTGNTYTPNVNTGNTTTGLFNTGGIKTVTNPVVKTGTTTVKTPTYTTTDIVNWLNANPGSSDAKVASAMDQFGITADQMAAATGINVNEIKQRYDTATGTGANTVNTVQQPQYTDADIVNWINSNPGSSDVKVAAAMQQFGITPAQMASATGIGLDEITQRYNAALGR